MFFRILTYISGNDAPTPANNISDIKGVSADPESNIMQREPDTTILLPDVNTENMQVQNADRPAGNGITVVKHVNELSPLPKSSIQRRNRNRPTSQAAELTSNPYKNTLEQSVKKCKTQSKNVSPKQTRKCKIQSRNTDRAEKTAWSRPYVDPDEVKTDSVSSLKPLMNIADCDIGQWCAMLYEGKIYPGKIIR